MLPALVAWAPLLSVTVTVNVNVPRVVGVPVMEIGGDAERLRPGGSWPEVIEALKGATPPERKKFCRYDVPTVPSLQQVVGKVIVSAAARRIAMLKAWFATLPAPSLTWIVKVNLPLCVGVPPIASPQQP